MQSLLMIHRVKMETGSACLPLVSTAHDPEVSVGQKSCQASWRRQYEVPQVKQKRWQKRLQLGLCVWAQQQPVWWAAPFGVPCLLAVLRSFLAISRAGGFCISQQT